MVPKIVYETHLRKGQILVPQPDDRIAKEHPDCFPKTLEGMWNILDNWEEYESVFNLVKAPMWWEPKDFIPNDNFDRRKWDIEHDWGPYGRRHWR